jgi:hypothetical protein
VQHGSRLRHHCASRSIGLSIDHADVSMSNAAGLHISLRTSRKLDFSASCSMGYPR